MGWIYAATKLPVIGWIVDTLYEIWADWRLALTGRPDLALLLAIARSGLSATPPALPIDRR
jgi:predicted DCC family thiol-disulfide oxidoreductase YuxK